MTVAVAVTVAGTGTARQAGRATLRPHPDLAPPDPGLLDLGRAQLG